MFRPLSGLHSGIKEALYSLLRRGSRSIVRVSVVENGAKSGSDPAGRLPAVEGIAPWGRDPRFQISCVLSTTGVRAIGRDFEENVFERTLPASLHAFGEFVGWTLCNQPALVENADFGCEFLYYREDVYPR